jgi:hypothetical protein
VPTYRLRSAIMAVARSRVGMQIDQIPKGALLEIPDTERNGMIEIIYDGRSMLVFLQDVRERGERVKKHNARSHGRVYRRTDCS